MIDSKQLDIIIDNYSIDDILDDTKTDRIYKLFMIRQALAQIDQLEKQAEFFESAKDMNNRFDKDMIKEILGDVSLKDILNKLTK